MKKINIEVIKNIISIIIAYSALIIVAAALLFTAINKTTSDSKEHDSKMQAENAVLESGNIENAIKTNQYQ
jgi:hypothetical protein